MSRKQKKKDAREQSTRQLMGIDVITDYGIATRMGELVFFAIKPTNISVLPDAGVGARIYALLNVVKGMAEIEMLALNSKESFENNKAFYRQRANEEELPVIRKLLEQDSKHLDRIQVLMASSREFYSGRVCTTGLTPSAGSRHLRHGAALSARGKEPSRSLRIRRKPCRLEDSRALEKNTQRSYFR